jgi:hypothetical protein
VFTNLTSFLINWLGCYALFVDHLAVKNVDLGEALGGGSTLHFVNDAGRPGQIWWKNEFVSSHLLSFAITPYHYDSYIYFEYYSLPTAHVLHSNSYEAYL